MNREHAKRNRIQRREAEEEEKALFKDWKRQGNVNITNLS